MAATVGSLEETALKRKERLRNLRNNVQHNDKPGADVGNEQDKVKLPKPIFRSYKPLDEKLQDSAIPKAKPSDVSDRIQTQIEAAKSESIIEEVGLQITVQILLENEKDKNITLEDKELDLMNLAPRKPDWDLKRDVAKKLEKLEKRTQKAIAELIRERLKTENQDLAQVVNAGTMGTRQTENIDDDDDD